MIWRGPMVMGALEQMMGQVEWGALDILVVDMPPGTGDVLLSLAQNVRLDGAILVTTPQDVAVIDADKCASAFGKLDVPLLGVVENMSYFAAPDGSRHTLFGVGGGATLATKYHTSVLTQLPLDPAIGIAADRGENYLLHPSVAADAYRQLATKITGQN